MLKKFKEDFILIKRGLGVISKLEPHYMSLRMIRALLQAFAPFIPIYLSGMILNELAGVRDIKILTILVLLMTGINIFPWTLIKALDKIIEQKNVSFSHKYGMDMGEKILSMDYEDVENHEMHMKKQRIEENSGLWGIAYSSENIITNLLKIVFSVAITYNVDCQHLFIQKR